MSKLSYFDRIKENLEKDFQTFKADLVRMYHHYVKHAEWEKNRADRATEGSSIQQEILRAYSYNKGRAAAIKEVLDLIGGFDDEQAEGTA